MSLTAIEPEDFDYFPYRGFTFSLGLTDGDRVWMSGQSGAVFDPEVGKMAVGGSMTDQATKMYEKLGVVLAAAGLGWSDVVHLTENVTMAGLDSYADAEAVRLGVLGGATPAVTTVIVDRLVRRQALIEVEVEARRGGGTVTRVGRSVLTEADGIVHVPTVLPVDEAGNLVAPGDFKAQYRYVLERAGELLGGVGLSLANAVRTVDYTTPATRAEYARTHRTRLELLGPVYPAAAGIMMSRLPVEGALVALDVTASRLPTRAVNGEWKRYETLSYSAAVQAGDLLFMSGYAAIDMATQESQHPGDLEKQAELAYGHIRSMLDHVGATPADLIGTIEYIPPAALPDYRAVAKVRERLLSPPWPASVGAVCGALLRPDLLIEIVPTAKLPS